MLLTFSNGPFEQVTFIFLKKKNHSKNIWSINLSTEVACSADPHTVLREDSISNQIITNYFGLVGGEYLRAVLCNEVQRIARSPALTEKKLREGASLILNELCNSIAYCPRYP